MTVAAWSRQFISLRRAAAGACILAGGFHAWLLAGQFVDGALTDPGRVLRWLMAAGITGALIVLARGGESLVGRKAMAAWVLAAMLHGPALADASGLRSVAARPEAVISLLQITIAGAALGLLLLGAHSRGARRTPILSVLVRPAVCHSAISSAFTRDFAPRPPPDRA